MARYPVHGSENDNPNTNASALLAEVAALRQRLAALEERLQENPPKEPPGRQAKPRTSRKTVAWLTTGAGLAMLAGASAVYGQSAVDAFFISKEGDVAIGPPGGIFVGNAGNVAIGPSRFVSSGYKLLVSTPDPKTKVSASEPAGLAVTTNEADNPFGLAIRLKGAPALADRSAVLQTTDLNQADGGRLLLQPIGGNVGIGTYTPKADNKLEVNGKIAAQSLNVDNVTALGALTVEKDATLKGPMKIEGKNMLEFGAGVSGKEISAGKIGYGVWDDALNIVGAGTKAENRKITFFAEGGATFTGNLKVSGTVDGDMKVVYQRDDDPQITYQKPLWRYHMSLTAAKYGGRTKTIPKDILTKLCGTRDGCEVRLGMTRWDNDSKTQTASGSYRFYYNPNDGHWRTAQGVNNSDGPEGVIGDGSTQHAVNIWNTCFFTDGTFDNYQDKGDKNTGMQLLVWNGTNGGSGNAARTCELTLIP